MSNDTPSEYLPQDNWEGFALQEPPADVEYAQWTEEVAVGQETYLPQGNQARVLKIVNQASDEEPHTHPRIVNLQPFLDGSFVSDSPSIGLYRQDGLHLLYANRWHTVIGTTGSGKSWLALLHAQAEMEAGNVVVYVHFEESTPHGTIARLRQLGIPDALIVSNFRWIDASYSFREGEFGQIMQEIYNTTEDTLTLTVLDGINAACGYQHWNPEKIDAVGSYRREFVTPATKLGMAVVSLGHPVKSVDRQNERHGFGSSGWLDEVDGASFRIQSSQKSPIIRRKIGWANLWCVKDRYGEISRHGELDPKKEGWFDMGSIEIDDRDAMTQGMIKLPRVTVPELEDGEDEELHPVDKLATTILEFLNGGDGKFASANKLQDEMRASDIEFRRTNFTAALIKLEKSGKIIWPEVGEKKPRPGSVIRRGVEPPTV